MSLVFFTDRDLGNTFPDILATSGVQVERHRDHFAPDCADEDWLCVVGERGWIAVSRDTRIRYEPNELAAVVRHHVALLIVIGKAPHAELARRFVATVARIASFLAATGRRSSPRCTSHWPQSSSATLMLPARCRSGIRSPRSAADRGNSHRHADDAFGVLHPQLAGDELGKECVA